jgi:hypothetical protein
MDTSGVDQAVKAYFKNDPYYPCPLAKNSRDQNTWLTFQQQYLTTSHYLANENNKELSDLFVKRVVEEQQMRTTAKAGENSGTR